MLSGTRVELSLQETKRVLGINDPKPARSLNCLNTEYLVLSVDVSTLRYNHHTLSLLAFYNQGNNQSERGCKVATLQDHEL